MKKNKAPSSSSWSLPGLYNLIPKCMYVVCKWLIAFLKKKSRSRAAALHLALSLAVGNHHWCIIQSELIHTAGLWIADSSRYLSCQIFQRCWQRIGDSLRLCLWSFTLCNFHSRERAPICLRCRTFFVDLSNPVSEWNIGLKSFSVNLT